MVQALLSALLIVGLVTLPTIANAQKDILAVNPQDKLAPTWAEIKKAQ